MRDSLKAIGGFLIWILVLVGVSLLAFLIIKGGAWLSDKLYPWVVGLAAIAFAILVFILLPLAAFKKTRGVSGTGIFICSYAFGLSLWVWSFLITYTLWGGFGLFLGLMLGGIGVVPLAMLATLFKGMWAILGQLALIALITFGTRVLGLFIASKAEE